MNVKIRVLHADAVIPRYATELAAGFDLVAVEDEIIEPGETAKIPLGLAFEIPNGYEMQVRPRSGVTLNTKLRVGNSPGTVDADFRAGVCVIVDNVALPEYNVLFTEEDGSFTAPTSVGYVTCIDGTRIAREAGWWFDDKTYIIRKGDRIAQGVIAPVERVTFTVVDDLSETGRGDGGFGHTGASV